MNAEELVGGARRKSLRSQTCPQNQGCGEAPLLKSYAPLDMELFYYKIPQNRSRVPLEKGLTHTWLKLASNSTFARHEL